MADMEIMKHIAENEHYALIVVQLPETPMPCYGILNRDFGVLEMSTSVLPHARTMFKNLNDWETGKDSPPIPDLPEIMN